MSLETAFSAGTPIAASMAAGSVSSALASRAGMSSQPLDGGSRRPSRKQHGPPMWDNLHEEIRFAPLRRKRTAV